MIEKLLNILINMKNIKCLYIYNKEFYDGKHILDSFIFDIKNTIYFKLLINNCKYLSPVNHYTPRILHRTIPEFSLFINNLKIE